MLQDTDCPTFESGGWQIIKIIDHADGTLIQKIERVILNWVRKDLKMPPYLGLEEMRQTGGWTETFSIETLTEKAILDKIEQEWLKLF